ncbi:MAG: nucleoside deaminase [Bacillota bacterium]
MGSADDCNYMREALRAARAALRRGELPCAAVLVDPDGGVIAAAHARDRGQKNRISHAELLLLLESPAPAVGRRELTLYTTLEPCVMCTAALLTEGVGRVVYGLPAPVDGGTYLLDDPATVARCGGRAFELTGGVMADECAELFEEFMDLPGAPPGMIRFARDLLASQPGGSDRSRQCSQPG